MPNLFLKAPFRYEGENRSPAMVKAMQSYRNLPTKGSSVSMEPEGLQEIPMDMGEPCGSEEIKAYLIKKAAELVITTTVTQIEYQLKGDKEKCLIKAQIASSFDGSFVNRNFFFTKYKNLI